VLLCVSVGYLLYLLLRSLLVQMPLDPLGPTAISGYLAGVATLLAAVPGIRFRPLSYLLTAIFVPFGVWETVVMLQRGLQPTGAIGWTPLVFVLYFVVLGWRLALGVALLSLVTMLVALIVLGGGRGAAFDGWLSMDMMLVVVTVTSALITRFVEGRLEHGQLASVQLEQARMDGLTGLMGRAAAETYLKEVLDAAMRDRLPLAFLICDIDNFKGVNDRYGHPVGDAVLKSAARRLRRHTGTQGRVARWGGEEFVVILPSVSKSEALVIAERLRRAFAAQDLAGLSVTASFGVAAYRSGESFAELFERADQRLYEAKQNGRNTVRG